MNENWSGKKKEGEFASAITHSWGFLGGAGVKKAEDAKDPGSVHKLGRPLQKEMATHSSILAWKIPWTEEPDRPQSVESQRVGHD